MHWIPEIKFTNVLIQLQMLNDNSRLEQMYLNLFWTYYYLVFSSKMMDDNAVSCGQFGKKRLPTMEWNLLLVTVQKKIIAPPRIVLLQNSSKFLALHHFDIATLSTYVSTSTVLHTQYFSRT